MRKRWKANQKCQTGGKTQVHDGKEILERQEWVVYSLPNV